jgi:hypothetical protein
MTQLLDHFRPPLSLRRHWHAFHNAWATYLASQLNALLPERFFAEPNVQFGMEIEVATFEESPVTGPAAGGSEPGGAVVSEVWAPPAPVQSIAFSPASETVEILVFDSREGPSLVGAIELVSPANKDRPDNRIAFISKCETYLQSGAGLVIVDVVTGRQSNLHDALVERLAPGAVPFPIGDLYATAYRPLQRNTHANIDIWQHTLAIGGPLPTLPLWLRNGPSFPVDLALTYERTCREQRIQRRAV